MTEIPLELYRRINEHDVPGRAAELAYRFLFALFPFFIFLAALSSVVARSLDVVDPAQRIVTELGDLLPPEAAETVEQNLQGVFEAGGTGLLSLGALLALWAASSGIKSLMKALNRAYGVERERSFLRKQVVALGLTVLVGVMFVAGSLLLIGGQIVGREIALDLGLGDAWATAVNLMRIPIVLMALLVTMSFLYWAAPNADLPFRWVTPGAVTFVVVWAIATLGFAFYVANFGAYEATYGALGGVIVLMVWLYLTSFVILLGAEMNALLHARQEPETHPSPAEAAAETRA